jgi:hypothetical protein
LRIFSTLRQPFNTNPEAGGALACFSHSRTWISHTQSILMGSSFTRNSEGCPTRLAAAKTVSGAAFQWAQGSNGPMRFWPADE